MTEEILDKNWKMKSLTEREFLETTVPGSVYQTYLAHGKMEDPFYRDNEEKALELLEKVGLSDKKDSYPCQLSGGQQQRVAIARALALEPDVLCFDEPTSALDPELTGEVLRVIRSLKNNETTMIVVTHEMEFAKHVSDKIIFMADGVIEASGAPRQLFEEQQNPRLQAFLQTMQQP